jgi:hypothetical protein
MKGAQLSVFPQKIGEEEIYTKRCLHKIIDRTL